MRRARTDSDPELDPVMRELMIPRIPRQKVRQPVVHQQQKVSVRGMTRVLRVHPHWGANLSAFRLPRRHRPLRENNFAQDRDRLC